MRGNYEIKKKIISSGNSRVFKLWKEILPDLTEETFLSELKWLCDDTLDENRRLTRELGLTKKGIVRLKRHNALLTTIRYESGELWEGDSFYLPCSNPDFADENGMIWENHKISLSANDDI